jgi:putative ABC transport system permease protein
MLGHYFTVALRNFRRTPVTTGINILALALGLTCFMIAYGVVGNWDYAERGFPKADRIYAITAQLSAQDGSIETGAMPNTNDFAAKYIKLDFPNIEAIARARGGGEPSISVGDKKVRMPTIYVDPEFLDMFDLPFIRGDAKNALREPSSVVLTEEAATKLYGSPDRAMGQALNLSTDLTTKVTGVIGPIPQPSHLGREKTAALRFDILASWDVYDKISEIMRKANEAEAAAREGTPPDSQPKSQDRPAPPTPPENWLGGYCCATYVLLPKDGSIDPAALNAGLKEFGDRRVPPAQKKIANLQFGAIPVSKIAVTSLNSVLFARAAPGLSITTLLFVLGGLVLAVAALNYANLATAQATRRAKEVGLRKTVGASRRQVMFQYVLEAGILTVVALVISLIVVEILAPIFRNTAAIDLSLSLFSGFGFWLFMLGLIAAVSLVAGGYPAFVLSRVRPVEALRSGRLRMGPRFVPALLVGVQFFAASFLLIAVIVMFLQNRELRQTGLGVANDPLIVITNVSQFTKVKPLDLRHALERLPQVTGVSGTSMAPWSLGANLNMFAPKPDGTSTRRTAFNSSVDYDYFSTLNIKVLAGRVFDREHGEDVMRGFADLMKRGTPASIVADEAFIRELGFASPADAVDKLVYIPESLTKAFGGTAAQPMRIIGVVDTKPLHFMGLGATSSVYFLQDTPMYEIARIKASDIAGGRKAIEAAWNRLAPDVAIDFQFMDTMFDQSYQLFGRVNQVFIGLAAFAFAISVIGLIGMAIQITGRRVREIGIRKTLGASSRQVARMLMTDFARPVLIANVIAWPIGFLAAKVYLNVFIHRIPLTPTPFFLSLAITLIIAWVAVGALAVKAARAKPATVLRYE